MTWSIILIIYLLIGVAGTGFFLGGSKTSNNWSLTRAWDQLTHEGLSGILFWMRIIIGWLPLLIIIPIRSARQNKVRQLSTSIRKD